MVSCTSSRRRSMSRARCSLRPWVLRRHQSCRSSGWRGGVRTWLGLGLGLGVWVGIATPNPSHIGLGRWSAHRSHATSGISTVRYSEWSALGLGLGVGVGSGRANGLRRGRGWDAQRHVRGAARQPVEVVRFEGRHAADMWPPPCVWGVRSHRAGCGRAGCTRRRRCRRARATRATALRCVTQTPRCAA